MRLGFRTTCLLAAAITVGACAPKGPTPEAMVAAADAVDQAFLTAFNAGDVDALMATYWNSPELVNIGLAGMGGLGWDDTKAGWEMTLAALPGAQLAFDSPQNIAQGDVVLGWGKWTMTVPTGDGTAMVLQGRYSDVKAMRDGKWVYVLDHASVPMPPAPETP
jgi:ketosteroid isomerase-like protein